MSLVYQHRRKDTGEIFYIGIGESIKRDHTNLGRNNIWRKITQETEYTIEIIKNNISRKEAREIEKNLILEYGRIDKNTGTLSNKSTGGEGDNIGGSGPIEGWEERHNILKTVQEIIPKEYSYLSPSQYMFMIYRKSNKSVKEISTCVENY